MARLLASFSRRTFHKTLLLSWMLLVGGLSRAQGTTTPAVAPRDLLLELGLQAWPITPLLGKLSRTGDTRAFTFLAGGHLYGQPRGSKQGLCATLRNRLPELARAGDRFFVSMGDFIYGFRSDYLARALRSFRKLPCPVFNAPGNHDWRPRLYEKICAPPYGCFTCGPNLFVILNTEIAPWFIQGDQLAMLRQALTAAAGSSRLRRVFIFSHKLVWAVGEPRYQKILEHVNGRDHFFAANNFQSELAPLLAPLARRKEVLWLSGDVGLPWSFPLFVDHHPELGVTFIGAGLGNRPEDALLRLAVPADAGGVAIESVALGKRGPGPPAKAGLKRWEKLFPRPQKNLSLTLAAASRMLPGPITYETPDRDHNGVKDALVFKIPVRRAGPGKLRLHALARFPGSTTGTRLLGHVSPGTPPGRLGLATLTLPGTLLTHHLLGGPVLLMNLQAQGAGSTKRPTASLQLACATHYLWPRDFSVPQISGPDQVKPGETARFTLSAPQDGGMGYRAGAALGTTPGQPLKEVDPRHQDQRIVPLNPDALFEQAQQRGQDIWRRLAGLLDQKGQAVVLLKVPEDFPFRGSVIHLAYVVLDPLYPLQIRAISAPFRIRLR